jgi:hypothetical protein
MTNRVVVPPRHLVVMFGVPERVTVPGKMGMVIEFHAHGRTFRVKRLNRNTWHLRDLEISERSRFGRMDDICADVGAVLETGHLPCGKDRCF